MESGSTDTVIVSCLLLLATPGLHIQSNRASVFKQVLGQEACASGCIDTPSEVTDSQMLHRAVQQ